MFAIFLTDEQYHMIHFLINVDYIGTIIEIQIKSN